MILLLLFDRSTSGDDLYIEEKLSTSHVQRTARDVLAVSVKRARVLCLQTGRRVWSGCTHRIRALPGHGYGVLCVP